MNGLSAGQVGCLQGSFTQDVTITTAGVTLQSAPGTTATICGEIDVNDSADNVTIQNLKIDGSCAGSVLTMYLRGEGTLIQGNDITNKHVGASCMIIGQDPTGWDANNVTVRRNVIHDCGVDGTRDQGIYAHRGTGEVIEDNTFYNNAAFSFQYWGDVSNSTYRYNVSDGGNTSRGNLIVGADSGTPPSGNTVHDNIITYTKHPAFEMGYGGSNNVVSNNCVWQTGGMWMGSGGAWVDGGGNVSVDPLFVDRANHNYARQPGSPCAGKGPR